MDDDELLERLEHEEFMQQLQKLQEEIFIAWMDRAAGKMADEHFDIRKFGDEPVFTSLLFDKLIEESE